MNKLGNWRPQAGGGFIVPTMVFIRLLLSFSALALATFAINHFSRINDNLIDTSALLTAEAGAEQTLYELNQNNDFGGYPTEQTFFDNATQGRGTYQSQIAAGSVSNEKIITATGRIYLPQSDTEPRSIRKVRLTVVGTTPTNYSVQTGPGGLIMTNSATIANGDVQINGYLAMSNSARIGSATNPLQTFVAHINCPEAGGPTYPAQCTSSQPITISNPAQIYGEVCATNQTNGAGMSNPGLIPGCIAPPVALPAHDRAAQVLSATNVMTADQASCSQNQTRTYPANTHIIGEVNITNNCQVTVGGDVWIDGKFKLANSARLRVSDSASTTPTIMIDGDFADFANNSSILANSASIGFQFINYYSKAACSPNCADVTGDDLYGSKDVVTIKLNNSTLAPGSTFYSRWTKLELANSGSIGSVIGQTIQLSNSGNISFGSNLSSGQSIWSIKNYRQVFD